MNEFYPSLDVLTAAQLRLWSELSAVPEDFVLYGGTALALHLGHRTSVDFDFFSAGTFATTIFATRLIKLRRES
jgi:hypothetical protein